MALTFNFNLLCPLHSSIQISLHIFFFNAIALVIRLLTLSERYQYFSFTAFVEVDLVGHYGKSFLLRALVKLTKFCPLE